MSYSDAHDVALAILAAAGISSTAVPEKDYNALIQLRHTLGHLLSEHSKNEVNNLIALVATLHEDSLRRKSREQTRTQSTFTISGQFLEHLSP